VYPKLANAAGSVAVVDVILPPAVTSDPCPEFAVVTPQPPAKGVVSCDHKETGAMKNKMIVRRMLIRRSLFIYPPLIGNSQIAKMEREIAQTIFNRLNESWAGTVSVLRTMPDER
jgi:hypothetical protein